MKKKTVQKMKKECVKKKSEKPNIKVLEENKKNKDV